MTEKNLLAHAPTQPAMPAQPQTAIIAPPPPWAIALTEKVVGGFEKVDINLGLVTNELNVIKGRVENLEKARTLEAERAKVSDERAAANSIKVKQISETDLLTASKLADVITWRQNVTNELANTTTEIGAIKATLAEAATEREALTATVNAHGAQLADIAIETAEQTATLKTIKGAVVGVITNKKVIFVGKTLFVLAVAVAGYLKGH